MNDVLIMIFSGLGVLFILIASIGIVRMPDFFLRLSVTVKATTLGVGFILLSTVIYFGDLSVTTKSLAIILFLLLTSPVGAQLIGRVSYFTGTKLWKNSVLDELKGKYNEETHVLGSEDKEGD
ncbi:monovalent cation/H(+) antiporter subunit G [Albibacterium bauzanense]|uniref:Multisubunit sodium/proton antiporter MrpG subunit n=1 Tax=Albibacterium bauzanense TaxID=653929 RepID=A0A4R1LVJ0_9SPHI|nr:monovalent cation/H(+) antiporter subunit G [Albibacterium bauzanense]TCK83436.1 multisubunit sodium/proton antiporter MrpG subunit [Albibacterium bauzanense]